MRGFCSSGSFLGSGSFHFFRAKKSRWSGSFSRTSGSLYFRTINLQRISGQCSSARITGIIDPVNRNDFSCYPLNFSSLWTSRIGIVIIDHSVVENCGVVVDFAVVFMMRVISVHMMIGESVLWYKNPEETWAIYHRIVRILRASRRPAIITSAASPIDPSRSPFVSGNPCPSIEIFINPSSVVEWCPTPVVVRNPCIAIFSHDPVSVCTVRVKFLSDCRQPYITVSNVFYPISIWGKFIIENLE